MDSLRETIFLSHMAYIRDVIYTQYIMYIVHMIFLFSPFLFWNNTALGLWSKRLCYQAKWTLFKTGGVFVFWVDGRLGVTW